ncbi:MAG: amino acid ABC transporter substrate-binding protein [Lactobacillales bacterium]|jgi:polar amino acid transport system substrate-binding protein|nr:amino acid ABC transporter substrate-binding protein [Lactobacillales bacterium]
MFRKLIAGLLILIALSGCGIHQKTDGDQWSRIKKQGYVIIGVDDTFVPMGFRAKSNALVGFDVDLARALFKLYGIRVDFQNIDWDMKETEIRNQTIDLIWNGYTKTTNRQKVILFSNTYMKNSQELVTLKASGITSFADMKGKIVGIQNGSSGYDAYNDQPKVLKQYITAAPVLFENFNEAFMDLDAKRIDGVMIDGVYAHYILNKSANKANYQEVTVGFESEDFVVGARKNDKELIAKINEGFLKLRETGAFQKISQKWFGTDVWPGE